MLYGNTWRSYAAMLYFGIPTTIHGNKGTYGSPGVASCLLLPCVLFNTNSKKPIIHPKWTTRRQRGAEDGLFITHLQ